MYSKDYLEQLAKDCAFEYDPKWWNKNPTGRVKNPEHGKVVVFYKGRSIFNGVVALWGRDGASAVLFYTTPHDVADEKKYGWIPPVFRFETSQSNCFKVPKDPVANDPLGDGQADIPRQGLERMRFVEDVPVNLILEEFEINANRR